MTNSNILPVITLYQPWATWIMRLWKWIETREHDRFKGLKGKRILIHAGLRTDGSHLTTRNPYLTQSQILYKPDEIINGFILGSAYVDDVGWLDGSHSKKALIDCENTKRYGLFLDGIKPLEVPIAEKGEMGIWYYDVVDMKKVKKPSAAGVLKKDVHQTSLWNAI